MTDIQVLYEGPIVKRGDAKASGSDFYFTGKKCKNGHICLRLVSGWRCLECYKIKTPTTSFGREALDVVYEGELVNRKEAMTRGLKRYFTGRPCTKGHVDQRWTSGGGCKSCVDREAANNNYKRFKSRNPERVKEISRNWQLRHPDKVRANTLNRVAMRNGAEGLHTVDDIVKILEKQKGKCVYCSTDILECYHVDHIMPLALGGSNWPTNLQCLCPPCNQRKGAKHPDVWHSEIGFL